MIEWVVRELPLECRSEALESPRDLNDIWCDRALAGIFPHLPAALKVRLLIETHTRGSSLASLMAATRREDVADWERAHWRATLQGLSTGSRQQFLKVLAALAPLVEAYGGQATLEDVVDAVRDVTETPLGSPRL